jgi:hypothetical protein
MTQGLYGPFFNYVETHRFHYFHIERAPHPLVGILRNKISQLPRAGTKLRSFEE